MLAAACCVLRAIRERRAGGNSIAWIVGAVGVTVWFSAEVSYRLLEPDPTAPYPVLTQGLLALSFVLAPLTLVLLGRDRIEGFHKGLALDGLIGGLAVTAIAASLLFPVGSADAVSQPGPPTFFLLCDLLIVALVGVTIGLTGWRPGACWGLMSAAIVVNTIGNIALVQATEAGAYERGSVVDTFYLATALLVGLATWYPISAVVHRRSEEMHRMGVPLGLGSLALALLFLAAFERISPVAIILATATLALIVARTAFAFRDNNALLDARERDSLTDGLTGLGNRRKLMADLEAALERTREERDEDGRTVIVIFDLDGFKGYNDAFGHPAGDSLLARLGANLGGAVGPHGSAYRIGGDEFCALIRTTSVKIEAVVAGAREALSEHGSGFSVEPSWGMAALGSEAGSVKQALQLADQRMYTRKQSRPDLITRDARTVLLRILREREPDLDEHQHAVAVLARLVGAEMELDNEQLDVLTRAAELHDIGKMATPDAILYKPGPLDEYELEIMRRHTEIGERILESIPALRPVARIVRSSHERADGKGYPDGLAGDRIPLAARIIAVCDAYNAMTTERPYDRVRAHSEALDELRRCVGTQFDPEVVDVFCRVLADGSLPAPDPLFDPAEDLAHQPAHRVEVVSALLDGHGR